MRKLLLTLGLAVAGIADAADFTWTFPSSAGKPKAEVCTFMYGKTWAYSFEIDDNPALAYTEAKSLFAECTATDAPAGVKGGKKISLPGTLGLFAVTIDGGNSTTLSAKQVRELVDAGWSVSNHGYWSTGIHWDKSKANDEAMYRREFFWGQFFLGYYAWDGKRATTSMVFPNGDYGYKPYLNEYGIILGTRVAGSPVNVLNSADGGTQKVNWIDCGRQWLDAGVWKDQGKNEPLWNFPKSVREGDWLIDFSHAVDEKGKGNRQPLEERLKHLRTTYGSEGADNVWLATSDAVAQYRFAAEAAKITVASGKITVTLPEKTLRSPLTLRISGLAAKAALKAPEGGALYRDAKGDVYLTTPVIGDYITKYQGPALKKVYEAPVKGAQETAAGTPQEIKFDTPVKFAGMRLRQAGNVPEGFKLGLTLVTPDKKEIPFNMAKYDKFVKLDNGWGVWRLFPQLPDEKEVTISALRYNALPCFNMVEVWAVE